MSSLNVLSTPDPQPFWNTVVRYGLYCGLALVLVGVLMYLLNFNVMALSGIAMLYLAMFAISGVFASLAGIHQRDKIDGGYITYGRAFSIGLLTIFIGAFLSSFWNYILMNFIDPGYIDVMKEQFVETWGERMPPEALEQSMEQFDKAGELTTSLKNGLIGGLFLGVIVSLISSAFIKKQPEVNSMR